MYAHLTLRRTLLDPHHPHPYPLHHIHPYLLDHPIPRCASNSPKLQSPSPDYGHHNHISVRTTRSLPLMGNDKVARYRRVECCRGFGNIWVRDGRLCPNQFTMPYPGRHTAMGIGRSGSSELGVFYVSSTTKQAVLTIAEEDSRSVRNIHPVLAAVSWFDKEERKIHQADPAFFVPTERHQAKSASPCRHCNPTCRHGTRYESPVLLVSLSCLSTPSLINPSQLFCSRHGYRA